ncbi:membrane protein [Ramlibacter tataouinensis]|uniref:Candidate membrane protein n=1 Tax=Ramlibacter tataouinensis (strain ATCC BAA-407 / DSM 14655 / LMG 21543 / TTB310) TaxID=365046 RepID=F5Y143_RAMTT|nr:membrane protein [Ramlibacter tataouinensis]AEG93444.1 candidate membrane protein [Ramlibacter tataouinensis TTB310]
MNSPTPAIVAQSAVRRLPRLALLLFCAAYVIPGFVFREPWKSADMTAFGYMFELARGGADWLSPTLLGQPPDFNALLPYWLGAWAINWAPAWLPADLAVRVVYAGLLVLTLLATWYAVYHLARGPGAQPVPFAFGGEAHPTDYARAIADGALLGLVASLGLAQLSHETTPALAQLGFTALTFYGLAAAPYHRWLPGLSLATGLAGLALSGAPTLALAFAVGGAAVLVLDPPADAPSSERSWGWTVALLAMVLGVALLARELELWHWRLESSRDWRSIGRLLLWFTWPTWPLALWTVWRWRRRLADRHVALPLWFALVSLASTLSTTNADRSLLLGLPALAALAAFALPTLKRGVAALIDWFTLLFFSSCAIVIWVVWISLQTGFPAKPASNVYKLAPGFEPSFSLGALLLALGGTVAWAWLVRWRTRRHQQPIWRSLVLPAGGAALCWLLMMTLWLPVLDYARSYTPVVRGLTQAMGPHPGCVEVFGLTRGQAAALRYHAGLDLHSAGTRPQCGWLVVAPGVEASAAVAMQMKQWKPVAKVRRPTDANDNLLLYRKAP